MNMNTSTIHLFFGHLELQIVGGCERVVLVEDATKEEHEQAEARSLRKVVAAKHGRAISDL
jgi:hypothetical protein